MFSETHNPAAAKIPVWRIVPPKDFLMKRSLSINYFLPSTCAPVGQERLLERQIVIES